MDHCFEDSRFKAGDLITLKECEFIFCEFVGLNWKEADLQGSQMIIPHRFCG